ncbi:MAG: hypothetical protein Q9227_001166 [Pyrenula ochraceoflavens]
MRLRHLHLPSLTTYSNALTLQDNLISKHLRYLESKRWQISSNDSVQSSSPLPILLTLEHTPVYTLGRRAHSITAYQRAFLRAEGKAEVFNSPRGGLETFHGPGQLIAYPLLDLRQHKLGLRTYVWMLEETVIRLLEGYNIKAVRTADPGVWMPGGERKIASLGVSVRRSVTRFGVGLNVSDKNGWLEWGFGRITACGLPGKQATNVQKETEGVLSKEDFLQSQDKRVWSNIEDVAREYASHFVQVLGKTTGKDIMYGEEELRSYEKIISGQEDD